MKRVEILLGKDGSIKVEAIGFEGQACTDATKFMDELFGEADKIEHKAEFYKQTYGEVVTSGFCG